MVCVVYLVWVYSVIIRIISNMLLYTDLRTKVSYNQGEVEHTLKGAQERAERSYARSISVHPIAQSLAVFR